MDPAFARRVTEGAAVVYHCMNRPRTRRKRSTEFRSSASRSSRRPSRTAPGSSCSTTLRVRSRTVAHGGTPRAATGPKGQVRSWEQRLPPRPRTRACASSSGAAATSSARTSEQSLFSPAMVEGLRKGKSAWLVGASDAVHAFSRARRGRRARRVRWGRSDVEGQTHLPVIEVAPAELSSSAGEGGRLAREVILASRRAPTAPGAPPTPSRCSRTRKRRSTSGPPVPRGDAGSSARAFRASARP
jgi:hypothetical protein